MTNDHTYLVTGATGFIGRACCAALTNRGRVRALIRERQDGPWDEVSIADLGEEDSTASIFRATEAIDTIFHLAAKTDDMKTSRRDEGIFQRVNRDGTSRLLRAACASGVRRFVYLSSIKAMGSGGDRCLNEDSSPQPSTPYGLSKRAAEEIVLTSGCVSHVCVLRPCPVYGAGSKGNLARMIRAVANGVFPPVPDTKNARSMVHVEDVVEALLLSAEKKEANGRVFIVSDGRTYSTRQIYEWISDALDRRIPPWRVPAGVFRALAKFGDGIEAVTGRRFVFDSQTYNRLLGSASYDSTRIREVLGFEPRWDLESALPDMVRAMELGK
ncbi:MAG: NAD-dependent epimerase/dehydratase family protein [bacterium]